MKNKHELTGDPFADWAELYELTHQNKQDDLPLFLDYAQKQGSPVLEIGCGTGRVTLALAKAGYRVSGFDLSENMLKIARDKMSEQPEEIQQLVQLDRQNMSEMDVNGEFTLALMPYGEFAHVIETERQLETLRRVHDHLTPDGLLIIGMSNWDAREQRVSYEGGEIARWGHSMPVKYEGTFNDPRNGNTITRYLARGYDPSRQIAVHVYIHERHDNAGNFLSKTTNILPIRYIFRYEMELLLERSGFVVEEIYGYYDKSPFKHDSRRMIFLARKQG
ncbi:MAG: class I SAM-dependent DNA methyltransferase [Calditrichia bacterium]